MRALRTYAPELAIAAIAIVVASLFARTVLHFTRPFGLPVDDAYIYLTYARQWGRLHPFTYFPGGGYSAGATSVLWPIVLAPFWALGARGHALVWVAFGVCTALYALACIGVYRVARAISGSAMAGLAGAALTLAIAPFAWTALAGMEVSLAAALLMLAVGLLVRAPLTGGPPRALALVLAALALARPEATVLVAGIVGCAAIARLRQREHRSALRWLVPLAAPLAWVLTNRCFAGSWLPDTAIVKSHFYLPGFDGAYWRTAVRQTTVAMVRGLLWDATSPFVLPRCIAVLWLVGAVRVTGWARGAGRPLAGAVIVLAPAVLALTVTASSGAWDFHHYRYLAPACPLALVTCACGLAPPARLGVWPQRLWAGGLALAVAGFALAGRPRYRDDLLLYAQNASDLNAQTVAIGRYLHAKLPHARVMLQDAGAVAYYGETPVTDLLGLVTNGLAEVANHGPGARFELLESLPADARPTHFAYDPAWVGQTHFFGRVVLQTSLPRRFAKQRSIGSANMQLIEARWDHAHTAERPFDAVPGWSLVDRVDIADLASEDAHAWRGALGARAFGDPTARWSLVHDEVRELGLAIDGGRTIRGGEESFTIEVDPGRPARLVMRTGGKRDYPYQDAITAPVPVRLVDDAGHELGAAMLPAPTGRFVEVTFELRPSVSLLRVRVIATAPYRVFHWFVLQPDR